MRLRATTLCLLLALGAPAAADGLTVGDPPKAPCPDKQYVIDYQTARWPGITYVLYTGIDGSALKASIKGADATEFLVFKKPGSDNRLVVGFVDGCMEDFTVVPSHVIDKWLAGQEAGQ